jgi:YVTN family beta-propeller protein
VIDVATNMVTAIITAVGERPGDVAFTPDGTTAYVTNIDSANVSVIDVATNTVIPPSISVGGLPAAVAFKPPSVVPPVTTHNEDTSLKTFSFIQTEYSNKVTWNALGGSYEFFRIYRDRDFTDLVGTSTEEFFIDHNRFPGQVSEYFIQGVNSSGNFIFIGEITVETP